MPWSSLDMGTKLLKAPCLMPRMLHLLLEWLQEVFLTPEFLCLVMEYAQGGTLQAYVRQTGPLKVRQGSGSFALKGAHITAAVTMPSSLSNQCVCVVRHTGANCQVVLPAAHPSAGLLSQASSSWV